MFNEGYNFTLKIRLIKHDTIVVVVHFHLDKILRQRSIFM